MANHIRIMKDAMTTGTHAASLGPKPAHVAHQWKTDDDIRLSGHSWGDVDGTPVILLHGSGQTRHAWSEMGCALGSAGFFALAFDARGHGDSDWSPISNYSQGAMIRDLVRVATSFNGRRPILVGAGLGGRTSLLAIGEGYVDAEALVLINIAPYIEPAGVERLHSFMLNRRRGFKSLDEAANAVRDFRSHPSHALTRESLAYSLRYENGEYHWHWDPHFLAWPRDQPRRHTRFADSARRLNVPTLLLRGEDSEIVSKTGVLEFLNLCPHAEYAEVRAIGHTVAGEHNDSFVDSVRRFLERWQQSSYPSCRVAA